MDRRTIKPSETSEFPWELISANCLRTLCQQLGFKQSGTKAVMIQFLQSVQVNGIEAALNEDNEEEKAKTRGQEQPKAASPPKDEIGRFGTSSRARKRRQLEPAEPRASAPETPSQHYNTRHKGFKRVRVTADPLPPLRPPRKSSSARRKQAPVASTHASASASSNLKELPKKRKRGRPRKDPAKKEVSQTTSARRMVFDGVVLSPRRYVQSIANDEVPETPSEHLDGPEDQDADGEEVDENDEPVHNGASSLASSNKENDGFAPPDPPHLQRHVHASVADAINAANGV